MISFSKLIVKYTSNIKCNAIINFLNVYINALCLLTVASSGTGSHHPGTPGGGAVFPGTIQGSIGDFSGTGLVFPWATNARGKPRRGMMRRAVFSDLQRRGLEKRFQIQKYISKPDRKKLAEKLGLKDSQVSGCIA